MPIIFPVIGIKSNFLQAASQEARDDYVKKLGEVDELKEQIDSEGKACKQQLANQAIALRGTERQLEALRASHAQSEASNKVLQTKIQTLQNDLRAALAEKVSSQMMPPCLSYLATMYPQPLKPLNVIHLWINLLPQSVTGTLISL